MKNSIVDRITHLRNNNASLGPEWLYTRSGSDWEDIQASLQALVRMGGTRYGR